VVAAANGKVRREFAYPVPDPKHLLHETLFRATIEEVSRDSHKMMGGSCALDPFVPVSVEVQVSEGEDFQGKER
jgi:hypothetical protein